MKAASKPREVLQEGDLEWRSIGKEGRVRPQSDTTTALETSDQVLAQDAFERGCDSIKLYRLLVRFTLELLRNHKLRDEMKVYDIRASR